jgi:predicted ATPase
LSTAHAHLEQGWGHYCSQEHNPYIIQTWVDPGVALLCDIVDTLWLLGYPDQAQKRLQEGLALSAELSHPFSLAYVLISACSFHLNRREWQLARERAEDLITLSTEQGFPYFLVKGTTGRGRALAAQGQVGEGIAQMQQGQAFLRAAGTEVEGFRYYVSGLAAAYTKVGRVEEGLAVLAEALALVDKTEARVWEAEMYRLRGDLLLVQESKNQKSKGKRQKAKIASPQPLIPSPHTEAEACFLKAIDIAQHQQAKSWELRASTSLARLWQQQGKKEEAHELLADIYDWFTEGFDTKDLQEAKALLKELSHRAIEGLN